MIVKPIKAALRWHLLNATLCDGVILDCMASASDDGIGVIATWTRREDGSYEVRALETESGLWAARENEEEDSVPAKPPFRLIPPRDVMGSDWRFTPFHGQLMGDWYESSCYGGQVPKQLPGHLVAFLRERGVVISEDDAWEIIESPADEAWLPMFESIFLEGARYALSEMADAVYDGNSDKLKEIDLSFVGVINHEAQEKDSACPSQHIMHPNFGGPKLFQQLPLSGMQPIQPAAPPATSQPL